MNGPNTSGGKQQTHPVVAFLLVMTLCYFVALIGTEGSLRGIGDWYLTLRKPNWTPPSWVFAPVWTVLYGLMGISAFMVWRVPNLNSTRRTWACAWFCLQLALNALWSWVFFAFHLLSGSTIEICVLWVSIGATILSFYRIRESAGWLLMPYLAWVTFAALLNMSIAHLNS